MLVFSIYTVNIFASVDSGDKVSAQNVAPQTLTTYRVWRFQLPGSRETFDVDSRSINTPKIGSRRGRTVFRSAREVGFFDLQVSVNSEVERLHVFSIFL
jgi:hypothetical protein